MTGEEVLEKLKYHITAGTYLDPKRNARQAKGQHALLYDAMIKLMQAQETEQNVREKIVKLWGWEEKGGGQ